MASLEDLKNKYASVLDMCPKRNVILSHVHLQDDKLFIQGNAPSEDIKNEVWNAIKAVDGSFGDLSCEIGVDSSIPLPATLYTVQAGDSLWKIAAELLGNGAHYHKIIAANPGKLKDEHSVIHPGDELVIPPKED